jgi:hypothetical protein
MQAMVKEGLDLARSMDTTETMQMLDLDSLLDSACAPTPPTPASRSSLAGTANMALLGRPLDDAPLPGQPDRQRGQIRPVRPR